MKLKHKSLGVFKTINLSGWEGFVLQDFDNLIPGWFKTFVQVGNDLIWSQYLIGLLLTAGFFFT
ncbi:AGCS family alanine/glycine:sodium (Na+) symporter, partial [human gut metagenome]